MLLMHLTQLFSAFIEYAAPAIGLAMAATATAGIYIGMGWAIYIAAGGCVKSYRKRRRVLRSRRQYRNKIR